MKKQWSSAAAVLMAFAMLTTAIWAEAPSSEGDIPEQAAPILNVHLPQEIEVTLDPFDIAGKGQIYSDPIRVINRSAVPVKVTLEKAMYSFSGAGNFRLLDSPVDTTQENPNKDMYLYLEQVGGMMQESDKIFFSNEKPANISYLLEAGVDAETPDLVLGESGQQEVLAGQDAPEELQEPADDLTAGMVWTAQLATYGAYGTAPKQEEEEDDGYFAYGRRGQKLEDLEFPKKDEPEEQEDSDEDPQENISSQSPSMEATEKITDSNGTQSALLTIGSSGAEADLFQQQAPVQVSSNEIVFQIAGSVNPNPQVQWSTGDLTITLRFTVEAIEQETAGQKNLPEEDLSEVQNEQVNDFVEKEKDSQFSIGMDYTFPEVEEALNTVPETPENGPLPKQEELPDNGAEQVPLSEEQESVGGTGTEPSNEPEPPQSTEDMQ